MTNLDFRNQRGETLAQRIARQSQPSGECIAWCGPMHLGYGRIEWNGKLRLVHRLVVELSGREVPDDLDVLHSCDNAWCVNPTHLRVGTHADNMKDRDSRGRLHVRRGRACPQAKLDAVSVECARVLYAATKWPVTRIAKWFGVATNAMWWVLKGKSWAHAGGPLA